LEPIRLVLMFLDGPKEGENDFLDFPSIEEAVAYGRELFTDPKVQLEGIEDAAGKLIVSFDYLNDLCGTPHAIPARRYG
jgi:hypothetical protein